MCLVQADTGSELLSIQLQLLLNSCCRLLSKCFCDQVD